MQTYVMDASADIDCVVAALPVVCFVEILRDALFE